MINYENEVEEILIKNLSKKYGILDENTTYFYIKLRYFIIENKKDINNKKKFILFLLNELGICSIRYKNIDFSFFTEEQNSFINIIHNLESKYARKNNIDSIIKDINLYTRKRCKNIERNENFSKYILYYKLQRLNEIFKIDKILDFIYLEDFEQIETLSLEVELEQYIRDDKKICKTTNFITEKDLEDYLILNLDVIEPGLKYIERQYPIEEGFIDILAKDRNNEFVIIELKIEEDKKIIWQSIYYPQQIRKIYKTEKVRMITVMPNYPNYLLDTLNTLPVEKFKYDIQVNQDRIERLTINKI